MNTKVIASIFALGVAATLGACGGSTETPASPSPSPESPAASPMSPPASPSPSPSK